MPALPVPDLQRGETQDTQPLIPQVQDPRELCLGGIPTAAYGMAGGRVWGTWAHPASAQTLSTPRHALTTCPVPTPSCFPGSPVSPLPPRSLLWGSSANGAGNLDPLPPSLALLIGSGAFSAGKAVIRGWIPTDREQPPHPHPLVPSNFRSLLSHSPILPPSPSPSLRLSSLHLPGSLGPVPQPQDGVLPA